MDRPSITEEALQDLTNSPGELYKLILTLTNTPVLTPEGLQNLIRGLNNIFDNLDNVITH